jgi:hypothetical protein
MNNSLEESAKAQNALADFWWKLQGNVSIIGTII